MLDAAFLHVGLHTQNEVIDNAVAILHHGGAHLYVSTTQLDELQRIAPCLDSSDTAILYLLHDGVLHHSQNMAQSDGLDGFTRVARTCLTATHLRTLTKRYTLDGIDGRDGVCTCEISTHSGLGDMSNIGRHLWNDRNLHTSLHVCREERHQFRVLTHIATHTALAHLRT